MSLPSFCGCKPKERYERHTSATGIEADPPSHTSRAGDSHVDGCRFESHQHRPW